MLDDVIDLVEDAQKKKMSQNTMKFVEADKDQENSKVSAKKFVNFFSNKKLYILKIHCLFVQT